jgi:oxygen-independent coproporphyrinogen III oxidase
MPNNLGLYIHIPFCTQKCSYCAFVSFKSGKETIKNYFNALLKEVELASVEHKNKTVDTIFIGGGTPSYVESGYITELLIQINTHFKVDKKAEITIEANPESLTFEKLTKYKNSGINRLSIGCQTTNNRLLKLLNRPHNSEQFFDAVKAAKKAGFTNINADLILALPTQKMKDVKRAAKDLTKIGLTHISAYDLILEENTPFAKAIKEGKLKQVSEKLALKMQHYVVKKLSQKGFNRYEVSAYSKTGYESKHNLKYWNLDDYLGMGIAAHSKLGHKRFSNTGNLKVYINNIENNNLAYENKQILTKEEQIEEFVMLSLRKQEGIDLENYKKLFNSNLLQKKAKEIELLLKEGLININNSHLSLTIKGFDVLNGIIFKII